MLLIFVGPQFNSVVTFLLLHFTINHIFHSARTSAKASKLILSVRYSWKELSLQIHFKLLSKVLSEISLTQELICLFPSLNLMYFGPQHRGCQPSVTWDTREKEGRASLCFFLVPKSLREFQGCWSYKVLAISVQG